MVSDTLLVGEMLWPPEIHWLWDRRVLFTSGAVEAPVEQIVKEGEGRTGSGMNA